MGYILMNKGVVNSKIIKFFILSTKFKIGGENL